MSKKFVQLPQTFDVYTFTGDLAGLKAEIAADGYTEAVIESPNGSDGINVTVPVSPMQGGSLQIFVPRGKPFVVGPGLAFVLADGFAPYEDIYVTPSS